MDEIRVLIAKYKGEYQAAQLNIHKMLGAKSIPDHTDFAEDLSTLVEKAERLHSLIEYLESEWMGRK